MPGGNGDRYLLARTFYWLAGGGATVTMALTFSLGSVANDQAGLVGQVVNLEAAATVATRDHDTLIKIETKVEIIEKNVRRILDAIEDRNHEPEGETP